MKTGKKINVPGFLDENFGTIAMIPALLGLAGVLVYPVTVSLYWSFTNKAIILNRMDFVGFSNYITLLKDPELWISVWHGLVYTTFTICLQIIWGVGAALLLDRFLKPGVARVVRLFYMVPWTFPIIVTVIVWMFLYNDAGIFSAILQKFGIIQEPMSLLASRTWAMPAIIFVHSWSGAPLMMMSALAGLQSIPQDQYDVAVLEGASAFQTFRFVILPNISRILQVIIVLRCVWVFNNFNLIYLMTGGGPGIATQNLPIISYRYAWQSMQMGMSSAVSVIILMFLSVMFVIYQIINNKVIGDNDAF